MKELTIDCPECDGKGGFEWSEGPEYKSCVCDECGGVGQIDVMYNDEGEIEERTEYATDGLPDGLPELPSIC